MSINHGETTNLHLYAIYKPYRVNRAEGPHFGKDVKEDHYYPIEDYVVECKEDIEHMIPYLDLLGVFNHKLRGYDTAHIHIKICLKEDITSYPIGCIDAAKVDGELVYDPYCKYYGESFWGSLKWRNRVGTGEYEDRYH